ncbi:MAG: class I SAM-dependent methyltransferase [bacterium]|nr:class I SAM-dependent methyltransferase [bacterium]
MNKDFWNNIFSQDKDYVKISHSFLDELLKHINLQENSKILDIGCGTGDLVIKLAKKGFQSTGLDISNIALEKAKNKALEEKVESLTNFIEFDIDSFDLKTIPNSPFDLITCKLVFAFIKDKPSFLKNIKNILTKNGHFVLITPVLYPNVEYSEHLKKISVDKQKTLDLLNQVFSKVEIFKESPIKDNGTEIVFIASL